MSSEIKNDPGMRRGGLSGPTLINFDLVCLAEGAQEGMSDLNHRETEARRRLQIAEQPCKGVQRDDRGRKDAHNSEGLIVKMFRGEAHCTLSLRRSKLCESTV